MHLADTFIQCDLLKKKELLNSGYTFFVTLGKHKGIAKL